MDVRQLWQLGDDELLDALRESQSRLNRVYGEQLALLGELSNRNLSMAKGYRSEQRLLQDLLRISRREANLRLAHAAAVAPVQPITGPAMPPRLPATAEAIHDGTLGAEHVEVIRRAITTLPPEVPCEEREKAERTLVEAAQTVHPAAVAALGRTLRAVLDQDGGRPTEVEPRKPVNELRWFARADGTVELKGQLSAEGGALLNAVLSPLAKPRPAVDGEPDARTRAERQGDALLDALRLAASSGDLPAEGGERPTVVVTIGLDGLRDGLGLAQLEGAGPVDARMARRLACDSAVLPVVLGGNGEPLDIGRKTRTVPAPMRRALVLRDGGCAFPSCTIPARWCDAHHRDHWADGGVTALPNLVLLCGVHHELIHRSDWQITMRQGRPEFIPPSFIDPDRAPRRNPVHSGAP